jgi:hypothetical protein
MQFSTIVGFRRHDFVSPSDPQTTITGYQVYIANPIAPNKGDGLAVERVYLSDARLARMGVDLLSILNRPVRVYYTRQGKVDAILLEEDT